MALRLVSAGLRALQRALGEARLGQIVGELKERFEKWVTDAEEGPGAVAVGLGYVVNANAVPGDCIDIVTNAGGTDAQQKAALAAAAGVAEHAATLGRGADIVVTGLGFVGGWLWPSPAGPFVAAAIVASIAAAAWQVQDHLDSTSPFAAPDITEGMRAAVRSSVT
jgi:hypothetical protein